MNTTPSTWERLDASCKLNTLCWNWSVKGYELNDIYGYHYFLEWETSFFNPFEHFQTVELQNSISLFLPLPPALTPLSPTMQANPSIWKKCSIITDCIHGESNSTTKYPKKCFKKSHFSKFFRNFQKAFFSWENTSSFVSSEGSVGIN